MSSTATRRDDSVATTAPAQQLIGWRFLHSRRWLGYFSLLLIFSIICVLLGNWQFMRRAEAQAEIIRIDSNYDAAAVPLNEVLSSGDAFDENEHKWQPVELRGEYFGEAMLARNRPSAAGVGSNLLHAFRLYDGSVFFIDRGWVPVTGADQAVEDLPSPPDGETTVLARLRGAEPQIPGRTTSGRTVASISPSDLVPLAASNEVAYLSVYGQLISERPAGESGVLAPRPERDEGPHLSYALQWYVFIIIAAAGVFYAARQEYRNLNAGGESVRQEDERRAERRRRRGPSDADEEDALLDG